MTAARFTRLQIPVAIAALLLGLVAHVGHPADAAAPSSTDAKAAADALTMVIMDPLAAPLSCPCVKGYAQRNYDKLAEALEKKLGRTVKVIYSESLAAALKGEAQGKAHLVIGKQSVVRYDAKRSDLTVTGIGLLTGKDGATTQTGLIVVPSDAPAKSVADLKGYRLIFGPQECDEKHAAALELLKQHGVEKPSDIETAIACDAGALQILDLAKKDIRGAAVISSYAKPLLEGCGTIQKGDLRVVGETEAVPFVGAFVTSQVNEADRNEIRQALLAVTTSPTLRIALETKFGFVAPEANKAEPKRTDTVKKN